MPSSSAAPPRLSSALRALICAALPPGEPHECLALVTAIEQLRHQWHFHTRPGWLPTEAERKAARRRFDGAPLELGERNPWHLMIQQAKDDSDYYRRANFPSRRLSMRVGPYYDRVRAAALPRFIAGGRVGSYQPLADALVQLLHSAGIPVTGSRRGLAYRILAWVLREPRDAGDVVRIGGVIRQLVARALRLDRD